MKRRLSSYHAPAPICLGCALALLFACCREYKERKPTESVKSKPTVVTNLENAANCGCAARELIFANAALGISTCEKKVPADRTINSIRNELIAAAQAVGGELTQVDVEEAVKLAADVRNESGFYALLIDRAGHFCGLHGVIEVDGKRFSQVTHGDFGLQLLPEESMTNGNFRETWICQNNRGVVHIPLGEAILAVDGTIRNFGEVLPLAELSASFKFQNCSAHAIVLCKPQTTCGCVVPSMDGNATLLPGENYDLRISIQSGTSESFTQKVHMKCWDTETGKSRDFSLELFGNRRAAMVIEPRSLKFGTVREGKTSSRTLFLIETKTDRFRVESLSCDDANLKWEQTRREYDNHLSRYDFLFTIKAGKRYGRSTGQIEILTTSKQYPVVKIPIEYTVEPPFSLTPKLLTFEKVTVGETKSLPVKLSPYDYDDVLVKMHEAPGEISIDKDKNSGTYYITFSPNRQGLWEGEINLELLKDDVKVLQTIKCVANVQ